MNMKKILYVATVASHIAQFHKPYMKLFKENGYEVHVAARDNLAEKNGLQLEYVDKFINIPFQRSPFNLKNVISYKQIKKLLTEEKYDLIICNTPVGGIVTRMAAKKTRKKGTKVIYIAHGFHFYNGAPKKNWLIYYPIEKHFAKKCDAVITINQEDYKLASKKFKTNVSYIHGIGVDEERYSLQSLDKREKMRESMGVSDEAFVILVVGELLPNKNQIQAIKAVEEISQKHKNIKLWIAGNGSNRETLERYVNEHGLQDYVEFLGYCTNLQEYQWAADVGVSCSIREGLGLNVIEAMIAGNTFIGTKNRGHNQLISDGENGFLVDVGDYTALSEKLELLMFDKELKSRLQENAKEMIKPYTLSNTLKEMEEIYNKTLGVNNLKIKEPQE